MTSFCAQIQAHHPSQNSLLWREHWVVIHTTPLLRPRSRLRPLGLGEVDVGADPDRLLVSFRAEEGLSKAVDGGLARYAPRVELDDLVLVSRHHGYRGQVLLSDVRVKEVALGGEGVPGDRRLLRHGCEGGGGEVIPVSDTVRLGSMGVLDIGVWREVGLGRESPCGAMPECWQSVVGEC